MAEATEDQNKILFIQIKASSISRKILMNMIFIITQINLGEHTNLDKKNNSIKIIIITKIIQVKINNKMIFFNIFIIIWKKSNKLV